MLQCMLSLLFDVVCNFVPTYRSSLLNRSDVSLRGVRLLYFGQHWSQAIVSAARITFGCKGKASKTFESPIWHIDLAANIGDLAGVGYGRLVYMRKDLECEEKPSRGRWFAFLSIFGCLGNDGEEIQRSYTPLSNAEEYKKADCPVSPSQVDSFVHSDVTFKSPFWKRM